MSNETGFLTPEVVLLTGCEYRKSGFMTSLSRLPLLVIALKNLLN